MKGMEIEERFIPIPSNARAKAVRGMDALDRHVVARCASGPQCGPHGAGKIVAYQSSPTYLIQRPDGTQFSWAVELCEVVDDGQMQVLRAEEE